MPTSSEQWADWLPFAAFTVAILASGLGALLSAANRLWQAATLFTIVFAISIAATLIYGI